MRTISRGDIHRILEYLDAALTATRVTDHPALESTASWNVRMARAHLLSAAVGPIEVVEALPPYLQSTITLEGPPL
jgi:hypothetical protein